MVKKTQKKLGQSGFTLVELLFVVILLSILGISVMKVITQVQAASQSAASIRAKAEVANRVFSDLRLNFSSKLDQQLLTGISTSKQQGSNNQSYFGTQIKTIAYDNFENANTNSNVLRISTIGTLYANPNIPELYGEVEARYYLEESENNLSKLVLEIWPIKNNKNPSSGNANLSNLNPIIKNTLADNISSMNFRFRQQTKWSSLINPGLGIPNLIEVTLVVANPDNKDDLETFRTALPFKNGL